MPRPGNINVADKQSEPPANTWMLVGSKYSLIRGMSPVPRRGIPMLALGGNPRRESGQHVITGNS